MKEPFHSCKKRSGTTHTISRLMLLLSIGILGGCVQSVALTSSSETKTITHFGISRIILPASATGTIAYDVKTLGLGVESNAGFLGWRSVNEVSADPAACQLFIVIKARGDLEAIKPIIQSMGEEGICVSNFSGA